MLSWVNKTYSTGQLTLNSADWRSEPTVEFNMLSDIRDLERLMDCYRRMVGIFTSTAMQKVTRDPFPSAYSERVRKVGTVTTKNKILTGILAEMLDGPSWLRKWLINSFITEGDDIITLMSNEEALAEYLKRSVTGTWHAKCR